MSCVTRGVSDVELTCPYAATFIAVPISGSGTGARHHRATQPPSPAVTGGVMILNPR